MSKSFPKRKLREKVCLECLAKCEIHLRTGNPTYAPFKSHKVSREYNANPALLYHFCKHYNISNRIDSQFLKYVK